MRLTSSNHWKFLAVLFPIIGTCVLAQPQPGGLGGFFQAWHGMAARLAAEPPTDYLHYWNVSANLNANDDADNMDGTTTGGSYTTNGFVQATDATSYITFGGPITNSATAYTISIWAKPDTLAMANNVFGGWLLNDRGASTGLDFQLLYSRTIAPNISWQFWAFNTGNTPHIASYTNVQNDTWYHLVGVADGNANEIALYVDGVLANSVAFTGTLNNASTTAARTGNGAWSVQNTLQFEGIQDKIRFYNRRLSEAEITAIYNSEKNEKGIP